MIVRCNKCGELYERFNNGEYQNEDLHICKKKKKIYPSLMEMISKEQVKEAKKLIKK